MTDFDSGGTFNFQADTPLEARQATVYRGQNRLLEKVAEVLDRNYPPVRFSSKPSPGDIVRQFIVRLPGESDDA